MTKTVLLVGNGAREHSIAKKIVDSDCSLITFGDKINPGINNLSWKYILGPLNSFENLDKFLKENRFKIDYAVIGPEVPLSCGITNFLEDYYDIPVVGPRKEVARIESSKSFTRSLITEYKINGNPRYKICFSEQDIKDFLRDFPELVVKPDGLTGGKGVKIFGEQLQSQNDVIKYGSQCIEKDGLVVLEEKLNGQEFTLQAFSDGKTIQNMPLVQDYKRAYDNDQGPNTGSMGSYSCPNHSLPFLNDNTIAKALEIMNKTINALYKKTGFYFKGILYGQFMVVNNIPYLIEFNVRFGDPEAINVLELLRTNFNDVAMSLVDGNLIKPIFESAATTCIYLVPKGYPIDPQKNIKISITKNEPKINFYFASVYEENNEVFTTGSRAIALVAKGGSVKEARHQIYEALRNSFVLGNLFYRKDIAKGV